MKNMNSKKGFTLIELLIVIAIIAVLAVAFLPNLMGSPGKSRDASRIAALQKIQGVLATSSLAGVPYPSVTGPINKGALLVKAGGASWTTTYAADFGGVMPVDPTVGKDFYYVYAPTGYSFGAFALVENDSNANATCNTTAGSIGIAMGKPATYTATTSCYAILAQ